MSNVATAQAEIERWLVRYQQAPDSKAFAPLADAYRAAGRPQDAVRVLEAGLGRHPEYVSGLVLLGLCWRELHEDERAEATFARVLELDPDNLVALRHRAECARRRGVLDRAAEYLRRALAIDPFDRDVQADLGLVTTALERQARDRPESAPPPAEPARGLAPRVVAAPLGVAPAVPPPVPMGSLTPAPAAAIVEPPAASPMTELRGRVAVEAPSIDLRRVGRGEPAVGPAPTTEPARSAAPPAESVPEPQPNWRYTQEADRIVVAPSDAPVRGPIRSVEDRLFAAQRPLPAPPTTPVLPSAGFPRPATAAGESAALPGAPTGEFATMTLGRIYESQGYLQKAAVIYEQLQRQRPNDAEIVQRLAVVRRRQAGAGESTPAPSATFTTPVRPLATPAAPAAPWPAPRPFSSAPAAPSVPLPPIGEESGVAWRLLDPAQLGDPVETAGKLRRVTETVRDHEQHRRHTVIGAPPPAGPTIPPAPPPQSAAAPATEDLSRGHEDYQRFLSYLRSLRP